MDRVWRMPATNGAWLVVRYGTGRPADDPALVPIAETHVLAWLADPVARKSALEMFEATSGYSAGASRSVPEYDLRQQVALALERAFRQAQLVAETGDAVTRRLGTARPHMDRAEPTPADAGRPTATAAGMRRWHSQPVPKRKKTWIEVVLVDHGGRPVAHERCRITLPDGSVRSEMLDDEGRLRIDDIDPGTCKVSFPDRDRRDWRPQS